MFWNKFNLMPTSHLESLLDKEDLTLTELMDEDELLQECKAQNMKLIDFLTRPEIIEEMVNLITQEPPEDLDERVKYKYPNTACEVLTSDIPQLNDRLANDNALLNKLYGFFESESPLNPLIASFISKTVGLLISKKPEPTIEFIRSKEDFICLIMTHLGTSAVMDLLLRLITCIETPELRKSVLEWLNKQQVIQKLVALIDPTSDEDRHCNAAQSLCDIIRVSRENVASVQDSSENDPLLDTIESQDTVTELLNHMFHGEKNESALINGISVLSALLESRRCGPDGPEQLSPQETERFQQGVHNVLSALTPRIKEFHELLLEPPHKSAMTTTIGILDPPLGSTRLHVAKLVSSLLCTNTHSVNAELTKLGTINILLDLFFKYSWNNFLHTQVEQCIGTILSNSPVEFEGQPEHPQLIHLFNECHLVQRIMNAWEDNEQEQTKPGGHRKGFMGHLIKVANHLVENAEKGPNNDLIKEKVKELPEDYVQKWEPFVSGTLAEINKRHTVDLVGVHPLHSSSEDDEADFRDIPFPPQDTTIQQAFSDYQMQQMTSHFIDQFGQFNDDEFGDPDEHVTLHLDRISSVNFTISAEVTNPGNAELFEQACNERIQQFDDPDSDEDIWEDKEITFSSVIQSRQRNLPAATDPSSDNSDNSTDSDEERDLPPKPISTSSTAASVTEEMKMEVDSNDAWPSNFDDVPMDAAPVAMDTGSNIWGNSESQSATSEDAGWADFNSGFANFASFNSTSDARSSSPDDMDTAEFSPTTHPSSTKYLADNPIKLCDAKSKTIVNGAESGKNGVESIKETISSSSVNNMVKLDSEIEKKSPYTATTTEKNVQSSHESSSIGTIKLIGVDKTDSHIISGCIVPFVNCMGDRGSSDNSKLDCIKSHSGTTCVSRESLPSSGDETRICPTEPLVNEKGDNDDDDLSENFNFLASAGMLKSGDAKLNDKCSSEEKDKGPEMNEKVLEDLPTDQAKIEDARARAKKAFEELTAATVGVTHNGPI